MPTEQEDKLEKAGSHVPSQPPYTDYVEEEMNLLEYWDVIWGARVFICLFTGISTLIAVVMVLFVLPVTYRSEAVLQPLSMSWHSTLVAVDQSAMSKLGGLVGGNQQLLDFLSSRNMKQRLIEKYDLLPRFYKDAWDAEQKKWKNADPLNQPSLVKALQTKKLDGSFSVSQDEKTELIALAWVDEDPRFASTMLKRAIQELSHYLEYEYETDAQRERIFIEGQLEKTKTELEYWENQVPGPEVTQAEIQRELVAGQLVYQELRKQLELAKIQEAKQLVSFKVLDPPFVPEIKYKPNRKKICVKTLWVSGFVAVFLVFIRRSFQDMKTAGEN